MPSCRTVYTRGGGVPRGPVVGGGRGHHLRVTRPPRSLWLGRGDGGARHRLAIEPPQVQRASATAPTRCHLDLESQNEAAIRARLEAIVPTFERQVSQSIELAFTTDPRRGGRLPRVRLKRPRIRRVFGRSRLTCRDMVCARLAALCGITHYPQTYLLQVQTRDEGRIAPGPRDFAYSPARQPTRLMDGLLGSS